jgi:hypothetical protein
LHLRADSGFWSKKVIKACRDHNVSYSITVRQVTPSPGHRHPGATADE